MTCGISLSVTCYSGARVNERPIRFLLGEKLYEVTDVIDRCTGRIISFSKSVPMTAISTFCGTMK